MAAFLSIHPEIGVFLVLVVGIIGLSLITVFNGIISLRNQMDRAWSNVDVILKQRFDELPALIRILESSTQFERAMIGKVLEARTRFGAALNPEQKARASQDASIVLRNVFSIGEAFPDLKSSEDFTHIQKRLSDLEIQIADRSQVYNETITNWNTKISTFPGILFRSRMNLEERSLFPSIDSGGKA